VLLVALVAGLGPQLGRLSLDAVVQRDVPERVRTSAFARSDTLLQLAWVLGGGLGIALPLIPQLGLGIAAGGLLVGLVAAQRVRPEPPPA
jgi:predicted branched-subunit amino acid permease